MRKILLLGKPVTFLCGTKGKMQLLYIENAAIFRAFSVHTLNLNLRTYVYKSVLLSVA